VPKYIIERNIPDAGSLSDSERQGLAQKSNDVLRALPGVQWIESYVTDNKIYCVYLSPNEELIREHARRGGFPADAIAAVRHMCDPTSAETPEPAGAGAEFKAA